MENSLFPSPIHLSCATKDNGPLTKIMRLDPETGALIKDGAECSMATGTLTRLTVSSLEGFSRILRSRKDNQAIVHGVYLGAEVAKLTIKSKVSGAEKNGYPGIARTKEFIVYPDAPGVMLFDHDKARDGAVGSAAALVSYRPADLLEILATIHPELANAGWVSSPSTSSCIYDSAGSMLRGEGTGSHIYLFPKLASDIPRYLVTLGKRLSLAGYGRIEISRSGSLLQRTLIDLGVGSPERLDFVAGAVCRDGLVQKLPEPIVHNGEMLDTTTLLDLTPEEEMQYKAMVLALKNQAQPKREKVVANYIEHEVAKLIKDGITLEDARSIVRARQDYVLEDADILFFNDKTGTVTVGEVLDNGVAYHGKSLADPLEPDYEGGSRTKAKFFWNDGNPIIHSYAHGSTNFRFRQFVKESKENWIPGEDTANPRQEELTVPGWPVMDKKAYRKGLVGDFIELATRNSEADPAAILGTFLVRFGVEVGPDVYMRVGDTKHRARLAAAIVGASSKARKGTSGKPVAKLFKFENIPGLDLYNTARTSKGPFSSGEGIIYAIRDPATKWNVKDQVEEIVDNGVEDKRLFVLDEEFGGVLANTKREGNTLSMIIRQAWDSGEFDPLTKNNKTTASGGHVGWVSHITLQELHAKLGESEGFNGFANRILWICAKRQKLVPLPQPMPEAELHDIQRRLAVLLSQFHGGFEVVLGDAAKTAWCEQYYADLTKDRPGLVGCTTRVCGVQAHFTPLPGILFQKISSL